MLRKEGRLVLLYCARFLQKIVDCYFFVVSASIIGLVLLLDCYILIEKVIMPRKHQLVLYLGAHVHFSLTKHVCLIKV